MCSDGCDRAARDDRSGLLASGPRRLAALRAAGVEPVGPAAQERLGARKRAAARGVPLRELARRTGLSVAYCVLIRRGEEVPHARW
jgi:hypothetical protein